MEKKKVFASDIFVLLLAMVVVVSLAFSMLPSSFKHDFSNFVLYAFSANTYGVERQVIGKNPQQLKQPTQYVLPFSKGEKLIYNIHYRGLKLGQAVLTFHGEVEFENSFAYFITFNTDTLYFKDLEKIYASKETFLPLKIERKFKQLAGTTTRITEDYDQQKYKVVISKKGLIFSNKITLDKSSVIHNAILLSYYYRTRNTLVQEEKMLVNLPTREFQLIFKGKQPISTPLGENIAYLFEADSSKFRFWLKDDAKRLPLKIEDPGIFGYSLILSTVEEEQGN
ncbi:DUF3108 domain-containing protein [Candidatus Omnitrophota bacterium]